MADEHSTPKLGLIPWLHVARFEYASDDGALATLKLEGELRSGQRPPSSPVLRIHRGTTIKSYFPVDTKLMRSDGSGRVRDGNAQLSWNASFELPLAVLESSRAVYELVLPDRGVVALPEPEPRSILPVIFTSERPVLLTGERAARLQRREGWQPRRAITAMASAMAFSAGLASAATVATADSTPSTPTSDTVATTTPTTTTGTTPLTLSTPTTTTPTPTTTTAVPTTTTTTPVPTTTTPTTTTPPPATTPAPPTTTPASTPPTTTIKQTKPVKKPSCVTSTGSTKPSTAQTGGAAPTATTPTTPTTTTPTTTTPTTTTPTTTTPTTTTPTTTTTTTTTTPVPPAPTKQARCAPKPHAKPKQHSTAPLPAITHTSKPKSTRPSGGSGLQAAPKPKLKPVTSTSPFGGPLIADPFSAAELQFFASLVSTLDRPPKYLIPIYKAAARKYRLPWQVLAAINAVETDYGANLHVSSKGAEGWMQFLPSTWSMYGEAVDFKGRAIAGPANPYSPRDAIFSAARYLAAAGARRNLPKAIFAYNHAKWYVEEVLSIAEQINTRGLQPRSKARRRIAAMRTTARLLNGMPYIWGGGHGGWMIALGYDCSGFVSAVLHSAGYLTVPVTTQALPFQRGIAFGPGKWVTIFDRTNAGIHSDHVIIDIEGQWWESGGSSTLDGASRVHRIRRVAASYLTSFDLVLHPKGL